LEELNEKLKKAYSNCMVAIVSGLKNDKRWKDYLLSLFKVYESLPVYGI
jgi:hypothetical protein